MEKFIDKSKFSRKRAIKDQIRKILTYLFSAFSVIILVAILVYIFVNGVSLVKPSLFTSDYNTSTVRTGFKDDITVDETIATPLDFDGVFSTRWGIGLDFDVDNEGEEIVVVNYIDKDSPFLNQMLDKDNSTSTSPVYYKIELESKIKKISLKNSSDGSRDILNFNVASKEELENTVQRMDKYDTLNYIQFTTIGGGIRGSLITTLIVILLTLVISLPLGIIGAIYLNEYAPKNKTSNTIRTMIDITTGIPSIIFGLVGAVVFLPITGGNYNLIAASLTMVVILLPIIIKTTEESLKVIPQSLRNSSLALGASKTQTIFKVVLPNALPGILTAVLLSIGRIIGESAALIFVSGTYISDSVSLNKGSTTLALHIWTGMQGDNPNYRLSCAISIIILAIVFILSASVKLISRKINKFERVN